jgi:hypothetical protein
MNIGGGLTTLTPISLVSIDIPHRFAARPMLNGLYVGLPTDKTTLSRTSFQKLMETGSVKGAITGSEKIDLDPLIVFRHLTLQANQEGLPNYPKLTDEMISKLTGETYAAYDAAWNRLKPAGRGLQREKITYADAVAVIDGLSDQMINSIRLDSGCIGQTSCYILTPAQFRAAWIDNIDPKLDGVNLFKNVVTALFQAERSQDLPGAQFYGKLEEADAALNEYGGTLFAIRGTRSDPDGPLNENSIVVGPTGEASKFDYAIYFSATGLWANMNFTIWTGLPQEAYLSKTVPNNPQFPAIMFVLVPPTYPLEPFQEPDFT